MVAHRPRGGRITPADVFIADGLVAMLVFLPAMVHTGSVRTLLGLDDGVIRRPHLLVAAVGAIGLAVTALVAALSGARAGAAAVVSALVQVAVVTPVLLTLAALAARPAVAVGAAAAGTGLGLVAALSRWRAPMAVACAGLAAVAALVSPAITFVDPSAALCGPVTVIGAVLLAVMSAAATAVVAAVAPAAVQHGRLPVVLGPLAAALVAGGGQVLHGVYVERGGAGQVAGAGQTGITVALLMSAAAGVAILALAGPARRTPDGTASPAPDAANVKDSGPPGIIGA